MEVPHLLAEHVGAGPVLSEGGLPVLVVVHGLLYQKEPRYPRRGLLSPGVASSWPGPVPRSQPSGNQPCGRQAYPTNQRPPLRSTPGAGVTVGSGAQEAPGAGTCTWGDPQLPHVATVLGHLGTTPEARAQGMTPKDRMPHSCPVFWKDSGRIWRGACQK